MVLMAEIRNCAKTTRLKASLNNAPRHAKARANGLKLSIATTSRTAKIPPIIIPINICAIARPASFPTTCNSSACVRNQSEACSLKVIASAGKFLNIQPGKILRESSIICAILANSTVTLPDSDLKNASKPAPAKASKLTITITKIATAHNLDILLGRLVGSLRAIKVVIMCTNSYTNNPASKAGNKLNLSIKSKANAVMTHAASSYMVGGNTFAVVLIIVKIKP